MTQLTLQFTEGLSTRYRTLHECLAVSVHRSRKPMKEIAADCDLSPSELSRRLNQHPDDPRTLGVDLMVQIMRSTGDLLPLHWLAETFLQDEDVTRRAAVDQIAAMLPVLQSLIEQAGKKPRK